MKTLLSCDHGGCRRYQTSRVQDYIQLRFQKRSSTTAKTDKFEYTDEADVTKFVQLDEGRIQPTIYGDQLKLLSLSLYYWSLDLQVELKIIRYRTVKTSNRISLQREIAFARFQLYPLIFWISIEFTAVIW